MKLFHSLVSTLLLSGASIVSAASSWSFEDATVTIQGKGAGVGAGAKDKCVQLTSTMFIAFLTYIFAQTESHDTIGQICLPGGHRHPKATAHNSRWEESKAASPGIPYPLGTHNWPGRVFCT